MAINVVLRAEGRSAVASGRVQEVRERARLSKREVAQALGVTFTAVDLWEKRHQLPRGETAERLGQLLRDLEQVA